VEHLHAHSPRPFPLPSSGPPSSPSSHHSSSSLVLPDEPGPSDSDAVLALRLQQELDRQAAAARDAEALEDQGLFFCQLCQRDLSHMTPEGREQHLNRSGDVRACVRACVADVSRHTEVLV